MKLHDQCLQTIRYSRHPYETSITFAFNLGKTQTHKIVFFFGRDRLLANVQREGNFGVLKG